MNAGRKRSTGARAAGFLGELGHRFSRVAAPLLLVSGQSLGISSAWAGCSLEQLEIPVRIVDQRPIAMLALNGTEVSMLLDSGAFYSVLSASAATQLNLPTEGLPYGMSIQGYTGRIAARLTRVERVGLQGAELKNIEFIVGGNELGSGIMGVLGRNFLSIADAEYDLAHGVVKLSFPKGDCAKQNFAHWAGGAPVVEVPLEDGESRNDTEIRVDALINGKRTVAVMDTGAPLTSLTLRAARRAGIQESDLEAFGRAGGLGAGRATSWVGPVQRFELGGESVAGSRMVVNDIEGRDVGMLLGLDYFLSHRIYVSRLQRRVYLTWNGGSVFALARQSAGDRDLRDAALPQDLAKDDADALARRGAAAMAAGRHAQALDDLNRAAELAPDVADTFYARARLHEQMGQPRLASNDLDTALTLAPSLNEARYRRAWIQRKLGDHAASAADLATLDMALPPSSALRAGMARLHAASGATDAALRQFDLWVNTHPNDAGRASVLNERCWLRTRLNIDLPQALKDCKRSVDVDDGEAAHFDSLGWTYLRLGDSAKARKAFDRAIKLKPLSLALYGRALAQRQLQDAAAAEQDLAAARELDATIDERVVKEGFEFGPGAAR